MPTTMQERVQSRLNALKINAFEAARRAGLRREFVSELLSGRKKSIRGDAIPKLARALECDPDYLTGHQPTITGGDGGLPGAGLVEPGVWREPEAALPAPMFPVTPHPSYPAELQSVFLVQGGRFDGWALTAVIPAPDVDEGDLVIYRRARDTAVQYSLLNVKAGAPVGDDGKPVAGGEIIGLVVAMAHLPHSQN